MIIGRGGRCLKRFFVFLMVLCLWAACCGCSVSPQEGAPPSFEFSAQVCVISGEENFNCAFSRSAPGIAACQTGAISFYWEEDGFRVSSSDLSVKRSACSLPKASPVRLFQQLLDQAATQELEKVSDWEWQGNYEDRVFSVFVNEETGLLQEIEVPAYSLSVEFLEFTAE